MAKDKLDGIKYEIIFSVEPEKEARQKIHEAIKAFNDRISSHHRLARVNGIEPLNLLVKDAAGNLLGGLIADTYWGWLDVDDFWLEESLRGSGLGRELLAMAEKEAIKRGCTSAQLKTFSFQAPGFYQKCGYRIAGQLDDYPPGRVFYWMVKELDPTKDEG